MDIHPVKTYSINSQRLSSKHVEQTDPSSPEKMTVKCSSNCGSVIDVAVNVLSQSEW